MGEWSNFEGMVYNLGAEIRKVLDDRGMTVSEFARRINKSRENVYDIFRRKSLDTDLLSVISQVLEYDFLGKKRERKAGKAEMVYDTKASYGSNEDEIMLMREELFILRKEIIDLRKRVVELEARRKARKK